MSTRAKAAAVAGLALAGLAAAFIAGATTWVCCAMAHEQAQGRP